MLENFIFLQLEEEKTERNYTNITAQKIVLFKKIEIFHQIDALLHLATSFKLL
jgi:hypothetical protein